MIDIKIMGWVDVEIFVNTHTAQVAQNCHQQILHRQITVVAKQHESTVSKRIFR
ncbi:Uncharacterised protein [Shigella sonnei]|nr:Uncharacterised protein [Shigella sonnei]CST13387.1 Uncharacterised protein [Shigella sonnei]